MAFTDDWLEDAGRRDFTFNALYADPDGTLYDPFDGRADLAAGTRALHRRCRHAHRRGSAARAALLPLPCLVRQAAARRPGLPGLPRNAGALGSLSGERVRKELLRPLEAPAPADALEAMREAGVLDHWLPEYDGTKRLRA